MILPGSTIGILGGGQLGRMTAMAARPMGYSIHVLDPDPHCAASVLVDRTVTAAFEDPEGAAELARHCQVVTLEIEKIGLPSLRSALQFAPVRPGENVLDTIQDRGRQKTFLSRGGFPVGPFAVANSEKELREAVTKFKNDCFIKSCAGGYDGRSQVRVTPSQPVPDTWKLLGEKPCVVEQALTLKAELSVMVARRPSGDTLAYPPALNFHRNQILDWSVIPAPVAPEVSAKAIDLARGIADAFHLEGLLCIEMFLLSDDTLLVNELAPRPHNSYHSTEVACSTSQFEQHVRSVCDLPLGSVEIVRPTAIVNLLGDLWLGPKPPAFEKVLSLTGIRLHLYGKKARAGRKMGHVSASGSSVDEAISRIQAVKQVLGLPVGE